MTAENTLVASEIANVPAARRTLLSVLRAWFELVPQFDVADDDALHRARVITRRARAILWLVRPMLSSPVDEGPLRNLTRALGVLRDEDVLTELARSFDLAPPHPSEPREQALATIAGELVTGVAFEPVALATAYLRLDDEAITAVCRRFAREWRRVRRQANSVERNPSDHALHRLRIRIKRVRYAASGLEANSEVVDRFQSALAAIQDRLGAYHDLCVLATLVEPTPRLTKALRKARLRAIAAVAAWPRSEARHLLRAMKAHGGRVEPS